MSNDVIVLVIFNVLFLILLGIFNHQMVKINEGLVESCFAMMEELTEYREGKR